MTPPISVATAAVAALALSAVDLAGQPDRPRPDQQVILITGATSGLGREVAIRLAAGGAHVIVHGRDSARAAEVVTEIASTGKGSARFYTADFASNAEVRRFAEAVLRDYPRLNVLVNNAGVALNPPDRSPTEQGVEYRMQVNYLSGVLLTRLLLPRLLASTPARIVNVSSLSASPIDFADVQMTKNFSPMRAYGQSKLAQVMFTFDLAAELAGKGITVNALHPATLMPTKMVKEAGLPVRSTIDDGAKALLRLILDPNVGHGGFFDSMNPAKAHAQAYDPEARAKLKKLSDELIARF
ncbi:MAG: SDR family NAD(P)-dependent oxidoreductase [Gemmatimonadetes bacterium]|nr:SDR family NAD(P)-dependent oxidoreductase [Gemmatimonadota bacterium]